MMKRMTLMLVLLGVNAQAQDTPQAMLRTRLDPAGPVLVGQPVRLHVDVLVTTWLTGSPEYPLFELEGALVVLPEERPVNLTERIEGGTWFGLTRSYLIYPQEPREYQIPSETVVVRYGQASEPARLRLTQHTFRARIPAEAQGLGYFIATTGFRMEQELNPKPDGLKTGDSIRRTITMYAEGTLPMFLPPVGFEPEDGLALYADPPRLEDRSEDRRGFQGGRRIDSATYIIQEEGAYRLPQVEVFWWDLARNRMRQSTAPAVEFLAEPNPDFVAEIPLPPENPEAEASTADVEKSWVDRVKQWSIPAVVLLVIVLILVRYLAGIIRRMQKRLAEYRLRYANSEAAAFKELRRSARSGNEREFLRNLYRWLNRAARPGRIATLQEFALAAGDDKLQKQIEAIEEGLYAKEPAGEKQARERLDLARLEQLRKRILHHPASSGAATRNLPDLNP